MVALLSFSVPRLLPLLLLQCSSPAKAQNLLINPSFESPAVLAESWQYEDIDSIPGWNSTLSRPYTIEVFGTNHTISGSVVPAADGNAFVELDNGLDVDEIYQEISTVDGQNYDLSFHMRPRIAGNASDPSETAIVLWNDVQVGSYNVPGDNQWHQIQLSVMGTGGNDRLTFREDADGNDALGVLLDNVQLVAQPVGGGGGGDPHFRTWHSRRKFDYHGQCDLVLVTAPTFWKGRGLHLHIRTTRKGYYSFIEKAALLIGGDILEFAGIDQWTINGEPGTKRTRRFAGKKLRVHNRAVSVRLNEPSQIKIDFVQRRNGFVYVSVDSPISQDMFSGSLGMIGSFENGMMLSRNGTTEITNADMFAAEWQVRDSDPNLFASARAPQYPERCIPPKGFLTDRLGSTYMRRKAEASCRSRDHDFDDCVFDVMATRDVGAAAF